MALAIAVVSGGMDSAVATAIARDMGYHVDHVAFNYGQRHIVELRYAGRQQPAGEQLHVVDLTQLGALLGGSALTDDSIPVPEGHYEAETMKSTVVANRNAIFISAAWGIAVARGAEAVFVGVHSGDHAIYPDCRPEFINSINAALRIGTAGHASPELRVHAPLLHRTKAWAVTEGERLGVDFAETWSCYKGGAVHCGVCGTCVERREAFVIAGVPDPTAYAATQEVEA